jgi:hypothetical protein
MSFIIFLFYILELLNQIKERIEMVKIEEGLVKGEGSKA